MKVLEPYRDRIDAIDDRIVDLLVERTSIIREVAHVKYEHQIPAVLQDRIDAVRERAAARAQSKGLDAEIVRQLYARLIAFSCDLEEGIKDELAHSQSPTRP